MCYPLKSSLCCLAILFLNAGANTGTLIYTVHAHPVNPELTQAESTQKLNSILQSLLDFHRRNIAKAAFARVNSEIWQALWRWCKQRHPYKGKRWTNNRCFHQMGK
ncbi:group II intron maturase-specific domain-containing protein [Pantoea stewartii]|uniref:group II intron maturase-specific domain-containing protein n=1 Tax=Pantoea stewartii TaxID=66269 RepID=UPI00398B148C